MKKKIFILLLCVVLISTCILCGVTGIFGNDSQNSPKPQTPDTAVTENMTFPSKVDSLTLKVGESKLIELSSEKAKSVTKWTSSDSKIVTVDDGGRVDASDFCHFKRQIKVGISGYGGKINHEKTAKLLNLYNGKS